MSLEHQLIDLCDDTMPVFPAGQWSDIQPHLLVLYSLARWCTAPLFGEAVPTRPPRCLEIGVRQGVSTVAILAGLKRNGGHLVSLDIDPVESAVAADVIARLGLTDQWEFHLEHSDAFASRMTGELDLLWIDGDHNSPQPQRDFDNYAPFVRQNGIIAMHDRWVEPSRPDEFGVEACVQSVLGRGGYELMTLPWTYGLVLMRKLR